jgi:hypothetical protein
VIPSLRHEAKPDRFNKTIQLNYLLFSFAASASLVL